MGKFEKKWKKAVWQYIMDHSTPYKNGYKISFHIKDEEIFWSRVRARQRGYFNRYDLDKLEDRQKEVNKTAKKNLNMQHSRKRKLQSIRTMTKNGTVIQRMRLKCSYVFMRISKYVNPVK